MATNSVADQDLLDRVGSQLLALRKIPVEGSPFSPVTTADLVTKKTVIFIHGFTANAEYLLPLMRLFAADGFTSIAFNYPCYKGFDTAAFELFEYLCLMDKKCNLALSHERFIIIGHSMGGLVARSLVSQYQGHRFVRKVITFGTPHDGTLENKMLELYVASGETLSGLVKGGFSKSSKSALQLIGKDDAHHPLLTRLMSKGPPPGAVQFYSLSAGKPFIEFGNNKLVERMVNFVIQKHFSKAPNDGLVGEASSDLSQSKFSGCAAGCTHFNNYSKYGDINHSHIVNYQLLGEKAIEFANAP